MSMNIEAVRMENAVVLKLAGRMDVETTEEFDMACERLLHDGDTRVVVDLTELKYISSAGLGSILRFAKKIEAKGGAVPLCGLKGFVKEVFEVTNLITAFKVYENAEAACRSL